jgi:hypothetical protein
VNYNWRDTILTVGATIVGVLDIQISFVTKMGGGGCPQYLTIIDNFIAGALQKSCNKHAYIQVKKCEKYVQQFLLLLFFYH